MERLRTAVVGVGHFGRLHADKYAALERSELVAVVDIDPARAEEAAAAHGVQALTDYRRLFGRVDAISVTVPTALHHEVARAFLESGVHVLVEKPITNDVAAADDLIRLAAERGVVLQVGHLERFSSARRAVEGLIGEPLFIECTRLTPFRGRGTDVNVILDLMIHDIDLVLDMVRSSVQELDAVGAPVFTAEEDIANARIRFANGCTANITASRISMKSERKIRVFQPDAYLSLDLLNRKITVVRRGEGESAPGIPAIQVDERAYGESDALESEIASFLESVASGTPPLVSGEDGRRALETALLISNKLRARPVGGPARAVRGAREAGA